MIVVVLVQSLGSGPPLSPASLFLTKLSFTSQGLCTVSEHRIET